MKRRILLLLVVLMVVTPLVANAGGIVVIKKKAGCSGGSERLNPSANGAVVDWSAGGTCVGSDDYTCVDEGYDSTNGSTDTLETSAGSEERLVMANTSSMGELCSATQIDIDLAVADQGGSAEGAVVKYSVNGGSSFTGTGTFTTSSEQPTYTWKRVTYSGLTLTKAEVDDMVISVQRNAGTNTLMMTTLSVLVTYE